VLHAGWHVHVISVSWHADVTLNCLRKQPRKSSDESSFLVSLEGAERQQWERGDFCSNSMFTHYLWSIRNPIYVTNFLISYTFIRYNLCNSNFSFFLSSKSFDHKKNILEKDKANLSLFQGICAKNIVCFTVDGLGANSCIVYGTYILRISYEQ
jgi:hypothetical protein